MESARRGQIEDLIYQARAKLTNEKPMAALEDLTNALRLLGGEMLVLNTLQQAREAYWAGKEADGLADIFLKCTLGARQEGIRIDDDKIFEQLGLGNSILAERGNEGLAVEASLDGSSGVCPKCQGLVSEKRMEAHILYWCPANNNNGN